MSRFVDDNGRLVPRSLFHGGDDLKYRPDECKVCQGTGVLLETIDEERYDVTVPCWACRVFCRACNKHVKKTGHQCVSPVPEKEAQP